MKICSDFFASLVMAFADKSLKPLPAPTELPDPRAHVFGYASEEMRAGVERDSYQYPWNAIVIIHWMPAPNGQFDTYQIGGIPGSKDRIEAFLRSFYSKAASSKELPAVPNVVVCGNNWGAGQEIRKILVNYSKASKFSVFLSEGGRLERLNSMEEPEPRKTAIQRAFDAFEPPLPPK